MANLFNLMPPIYLFPIQWGKSNVRERYDGKVKSGRLRRLYLLISGPTDYLRTFRNTVIILRPKLLNSVIFT